MPSPNPASVALDREAPPTLRSHTPVVLFSGYTVACFVRDGSMAGGRDGLYDFDTRLLSTYRLTIDGRAPDLVTSDRPEADRWEAALRVPREGGTASGPLLPQDTLDVFVRRRVGPGMIETITVRNRSMEPWDVALALEIDGDFADLAEVGRRREQHGRLARTSEADASTLLLRYTADHADRALERGLRVQILDASSDPAATPEGFRFPLRLEPGGAWSATVRFDSLVDGHWRRPPLDGDRRSRQRTRWRSIRPAVEGDERLRDTFARAADDLFDLRNWELEQRYVGDDRGAAWILNAGVPSFTGIFGRDAVTAGWQAALLGPRIALGSLAVTASTMATRDDPWRDAEPGKMIHEIRRGPLADLGLSPRDAYYGSQTTAAMFVIALSEAWHWTGGTAVLQRHRDAAVAGLDWAERYGDADGDGFLEYRSRSPRGLRNQGWKDSNEAIRFPDGSLVDGPIATVEEQAFHYIALQRMAEILVALGEDRRATGYAERAEELRRRWHDAFWMPDERFYALALDGRKRQVRTIASNAGHALAAGIVPPEHAREVADRLLSPELFSGWGIRTLSARHPSYNPFAYHLGAVWPVEQATFALGMKRYGLDDHAERLIGAVLDAADRCPDRRLPEALSGHERSSLGRPILYPSANSPQAWSSSAVIQLVQVMLGIYPFAPLGVLALVRPRLPAWLPEITLRGLRVGGARVDLRVRRRPDGSAGHRVLSRRGRLTVVTAGPPEAVGDQGLDIPERLKREVLRRTPGRRASAARLALGLGGPEA